MSIAALTLAFGWSPEIRGILMVTLMFMILCGSTYLLLATNLGARLGLMVALAGLAGWLTIMSSIWWVYGIGYVGTRASWKPVEVINNPAQLADSALPDAGDLTSSKWRALAPDDTARGQAQAAADEILTTESQRFLATSQYLPVAVYDYGGHTYPDWFFNLWHTPHYSLVQVQPVLVQPTDPGQAPPKPVLDPNSPVVSVIMVRDLGDLRVPPATLCISSAIVLGLLCRRLHLREKRVRAALEAPEVEVPETFELDRV
jgi:hypothetical protein